MADRRRGTGRPIPPRWVFRAYWVLHRGVYALSGGRLGLRAAAEDRLGTLRLITVGRRSGAARAMMLYYLPAGEGFAVVASNAGASHAPAWWLNLQTQAAASVEVPGRSMRVRARDTAGAERADLWRRFVAVQPEFQRYAEAAEREIPVVVLEPIDPNADA